MSTSSSSRIRRFAGSSRVPNIEEFSPEEFGLPVVPHSRDEVSEFYSEADVIDALSHNPTYGFRVIPGASAVPSTRRYRGLQSGVRPIDQLMFPTVLEVSSGYQDPFFIGPLSVFPESTALAELENAARSEFQKVELANNEQIMREGHNLINRWSAASINEYELLSVQTRGFLSTYQNAGWDYLQLEIPAYEAEPDRLEPLFSFLADFAGEINSPAAQYFFTRLLENARPAWRYLAAIVLNRIGHEWAAIIATGRLAKEKNSAVKAALQTAC